MADELPETQHWGHGQPRVNARNAFCNSNQLHVNFVPYQVSDQFPLPPSGPQDAAGLEGADVFGPAPGRGA